MEHTIDITAFPQPPESRKRPLEKSRNTTMHGGVLAQEDVERIGMNIRDWTRQTG
jgi:hypothetical protein